MQAEGSTSRPSLSSRLNLLLSSLPLQKANASSLFHSEPSSSRHSTDSLSSETMRSARTRPPSPRHAHSNAGRASHNRSAMSLTLNTSHESTSQRQKQRAPEDAQTSSFPVLRWFSSSTTQADVKHKRSQSSVSSRPDASPVYSDSPVDSASSSTSHVLAIADALDDDPRLVHARSPTVELPSRPKAARLPAPLRPWRPPSHLSDLSRSALPTAGLSPASYYVRPHHTDPYDDPFAAGSQQEHEPQMDIFFSPTPTPVAIPHSPAPAHLSRSPPSISPSSTRSSIDTLRSIQERGSRGIHTTPPSQRLSLPTFKNPFQWFSGDEDTQRKENMDPFLSEEDKAHNARSQQQVIQQRYASPKNPIVFCHGLLGFDTVTLGPSIAPLQVTHWRGIKDALEANGCEVLITRVPATSTPVDRAKVLEEKISSVYPGRSVHLIGFCAFQVTAWAG